MKKFRTSSEYNIFPTSGWPMEEMCVNEKTYEVIKLLGHGKGGYSYLVTDGTKEIPYLIMFCEMR